MYIIIPTTTCTHEYAHNNTAHKNSQRKIVRHMYDMYIRTHFLPPQDKSSQRKVHLLQAYVIVLLSREFWIHRSQHYITYMYIPTG